MENVTLLYFVHNVILQTCSVAEVITITFSLLMKNEFEQVT